MKDSLAQEHASTPTSGEVWLTVHKDAITWIARGNSEWWYEPTATRPRRLNLQRIAADTGLSRSKLYRIAKGGGGRVRSETIGQLVDLAMRSRGVSETTALVRVCKVEREQLTIARLRGKAATS